MDESEGVNYAQLYQQRVKPLEAEHWGEFIAIHLDGRALIGKDRKELRQHADSKIGEDSIIFRIGPMVSPGFRWLRAVPHTPGTLVHPEEEDENSDDPARVREVAERRAGLYARYGKCLEPEYWGQYVAIQPNGATILEKDFDSLATRARNELGKGSVIFKVGGNNKATKVKPLELILHYHD